MITSTCILNSAENTDQVVIRVAIRNKRKDIQNITLIIQSTLSIYYNIITIVTNTIIISTYFLNNGRSSQIVVKERKRKVIYNFKK